MPELETETETATEEPVSLRNELAQKLAGEPEEEIEEETPAEEPQEEEAEPEAEETPEEAAPATEDELSPLPNQWTDEEKQAFLDIPDQIETKDGEIINLQAIKNVVQKRYEDLNKGFQESARKNAAARKDGEEWNKLLDPYKPQLTTQGINGQQWVSSILQRVHSMQANPATAIKQLISEFKVDPKDLGFKTQQSVNMDDPDGLDDPKVAELETTVNNLTSRLDSYENQTVQTRNEGIQNEISAFRDNVDSKGNLSHPLFEEARDEMYILMNTGKAKSLKEAYDMSPTVRVSKLEIVKDPEEDKKALEKARAEAAKAKKAGKTVKTRSGNNSTFNGMSIREQLAARIAVQ